MSLLSDLVKFTEATGSDQNVKKKQCLEYLLASYSLRSYYEIFGFDSTVAPDKSELSTIWKSILLIIHPDKAKGKVYEKVAEALTKLLNVAYETLSNDEQERKYRYQRLAAKSQGANNNNNNNNSRFYSSATGASASAYGAGQGFFASFSQTRQELVERRDILVGETIDVGANSITIIGNVYGVVKSKGGNINVEGSVLGGGSVISERGKINVRGVMAGIIKNTYGDNCAGSTVSGKIINVNGCNFVYGQVSEGGSVKTENGSNTIRGCKQSNFYQGAPQSSQNYRP